MRPFELINVKSFEEAAERKAKSADLMAGGTDLLNVYKHGLLEEHPQYVLNLKTIPDSEGIEEDDRWLTIKAMTKLSEIGESELINSKAKGLAQAALSVATPLIRNVGTIGGNICQDVRCWYYRYPHEAGGRIDCSRKGGAVCYAIQGENRYHSIFGGRKTHADPCTKGCPAGTDIPAYMEMIRKGKWDEAARIIMKVNPMPMLTSRICPHPCQDSCNQRQYGDCVQIHCVERTLGDYILKNASRFYVGPEKETGKKAVIVGAGPGGLACAYMLRTQGHDVTVIDSHDKAGGVLMYGIPHYRLPKTIVDDFITALEGMGIKFKLNTTVGKDVSVEKLTEAYDSVYFGTGAWKQPILGIQGEELTQFGLDFLVEVNTFLKNAIDDEVLVCGGGNVAMDVALTAKRMGAKNVKLICLEKEEEMPASREEVERAKEEGIEIWNGWGLKAVKTDGQGKVTGLESVKCVSVFDEQGRFAPVYDEDDRTVYAAKSIILATGQRVDIDFLGEKLGKQLKSARGLIEVDMDSFQTSNEKIFAGGDAVTGPNIAIRAVKAGVTAAKTMSRAMGYPAASCPEKTGFLTYDTEGVKNTAGVRLKERPVGQRTIKDEDSQSLSMEEAAREASRCMNCGCYSVNASDISPVLVAFQGNVVTTKKTIAAEDFFTTELKATDLLDQDEIVKAVQIPDMEGYETGYEKARIRSSIDFALLSMAYAYQFREGKFEDVRIVLGGAAPVPVKLREVEQFLEGKEPSEELAAQAAELAVKDVVPMELNHYKVNQAKAFIERLILNKMAR